MFEVKIHIWTIKKYCLFILSFFKTMIVVIAIAIIISYIFPIYHVTENNMTPLINQDDYIVVSKISEIKENDLIVFYQGKHLLLRRCIARSGRSVNIQEGYVYIDNQLLVEDYTNDYTYPLDITFPIVVKEKQYFVLADQREDSIDSRHSSIGLINEEDIVGKVILRIYPFKQIKII